MHEVVIKYKNQKTLKALTALGEYLGFTIADPKKKRRKKKKFTISMVFLWSVETRRLICKP